MNANVDKQRCGHDHHAATSQGAGPRADRLDAAGFAMPVGRNRWSRTVLIRANLTPCEWTEGKTVSLAWGEQNDKAPPTLSRPLIRAGTLGVARTLRWALK